MGLVVYETEALVLAIFIELDDARRDCTKRPEEVMEFILCGVGVEILDVQICELGLHLVDLGLPLLGNNLRTKLRIEKVDLPHLAGDMMPNKDLLVIEQHAIDSLDGGFGSLASFIVDKSIATRSAILVGRDFAGKNIAERSKRVVESLASCMRRSNDCTDRRLDLIVNLLIQVLDKNVALSGFAESRITLRPHDTAVGRCISE